MPQMSKVELYAAIRRDHWAGLTMRELERKYNVAWRAVRKALNSAWPEPRNPLPPRPSALDPYKTVIDGILRADLDAPRKQRHTVTRIFHRLVEEHGVLDTVPLEDCTSAHAETQDRCPPASISPATGRVFGRGRGSPGKERSLC